MAIVANNPFEMTNEDVELDEIFHGEPKPLHPDTVYQTFGKPTSNGNPAKAVKAPAIEPKTEPNTAKDAKWNPAKPDPNGLDRLKDCAKWVGLFGGLCVLLFYWQQTGQMESSAAVPSMCACCGLAGLSIGKNTVRGNR